MSITDEVQVKLDRVRGLMKEKHLDVVLLSKNENFSGLPVVRALL